MNMDEIAAKRPCPACGTPTLQEANFCGRCGTKMVPVQPLGPRLDRVLSTHPHPEQDDREHWRSRRLYFAGCGIFLLTSPFLVFLWWFIFYHFNRSQCDPHCRVDVSFATFFLALLGQGVSMLCLWASAVFMLKRNLRLKTSGGLWPSALGTMFTGSQVVLILTLGVIAALRHVNGLSGNTGFIIKN